MAKQAIGMLEVKGIVTLMQAADAALKSADVTMLGWEKIGSGLVTGFFSGNIAAVKAAIDAGADAAKKIGEVSAAQVIARPHDDLNKLGKFIA